MYEVIREKYLVGQLELTNYDFDTFLIKNGTTPNFRKITDNSRYKLKQILFKMLREVGLLDKKIFFKQYRQPGKLLVLLQIKLRTILVFL